MRVLPFSSFTSAVSSYSSSSGLHSTLHMFRQIYASGQALGRGWGGGKGKTPLSHTFPFPPRPAIFLQA